MTTLLVAHLHFCRHTNPKKNAKEPPSQRTKDTAKWTDKNTTEKKASL
jgi:hypothetical protein